MGYSLGARFKSTQEQETMYQFYCSNNDIIESLSIAEGRNDSKNFMDLNFELSYAPKVKYLLGYDGPSGRPYYLELLIAWMAVKSTYRDKSNKPFIYYDHEKIFVKQKNSFFIQVDDRGIQTVESSIKLQKENPILLFNLYRVTDFEKYAKTIEYLFNKLEERWQDFQLKQVKSPVDKICERKSFLK
jgi:hypothetical protein